MRVLFATGNSHKVVEARRIFGLSGWEIISLSEIGFFPKFVETESSYRDNARLKARMAFERFRMWTIGEDSGLEVDALGGKPGVVSARFGGNGISSLERNYLVLKMMNDVPDPLRTARFRCVVCLIEPGGKELFFEGVCQGRIARDVRGENGFGYDPIFIPDGYSQTFAELGGDVKDLISHRAQALRQVIEHLRSRVKID